MDLEELYQRFPDMTPTNRAPTLFSVNGLGLTVYGRRNVDPETGTYVKTHFLIVFFVPLFALGAYRVADHPEGSGWLFLGKVPVGSFAKTWNLLLAGLLFGSMGLGVFNGFMNDPARLAEKAVAAAETKLSRDDYVAAVNDLQAIDRDYSQVPGVGDDVGARLNLILTETLPGLPLEQRIPLFQALAARPFLLEPGPFQRIGRNLVEEIRHDRPDQAYYVLKPLRAGRPKHEELAVLESEVVILWNRQNPKAPVPAEVLAKNALADGDTTKARSLLEAAKDNLGQREGAYLLAQMLLEAGDRQAALPLLRAYLTPRLSEIRDAAAAYDREMDQFTDAEITSLQNGFGPDSFYEAFEAADEAGQQALVHKYLNERAENHPLLTKAQQRVEKANELVPAVLDLGLLQMEAAGTMVGEERTQSLKAAEHTLLAVGGLMGDNNQYRLFLGQVKYWLGREEEGRDLFKKVLEDSQRDSKVLLEVADSAREVGDTVWARSLSEEAYERATLKETAYEAAFMCYVLASDLEARIQWLDKADPNATHVAISRNEAKASLAVRDGDTAKARGFYQEAIKGYEGQVESAAGLNNAALIWSHLFELSGDLNELQKGVALMEKAVALEPSDPILLNNTADQLVHLGVAQLIEKECDLKRFADRLNILRLDFLITKDRSVKSVRAAVAQNASFQKAVTFWERALILSPKNYEPYDDLDDYYYFMNDGKNLSRIQQAMARVRLNTESPRKFQAMAENRSWPDFMLSRQQEQVAKLEGDLASGELKGKLTRSMVAALLNRTQKRSRFLGQAVSAEAVLRSAQRAHDLRPSLATARKLIDSHYFAAHWRLVDTVPEYAALVAETKHTVDHAWLIGSLAAGKHPLTAKILADTDVKRAAELEWALFQNWPDRTNVIAWAVLQGLDPNKADALAKVLRQSAAHRAHADLISQIWSTTPNNVLRQVLWFHLEGNPAGAETVVTEARRRNVPVPIL